MVIELLNEKGVDLKEEHNLIGIGEVAGLWVVNIYICGGSIMVVRQY